MFRKGEVSRADVEWVMDGGRPESLLVRIVACGEVYVGCLWERSRAPRTPAEVTDKLASELQDFIAESSFGWGERRGLPKEL